MAAAAAALRYGAQMLGLVAPPPPDPIIRMPLVSKKDGRISPYDVLLFRSEWTIKGVYLPEPIPKLYNGIDGVVIIGATFKGAPEAAGIGCAVRIQGLDCNIADKEKDPRTRTLHGEKEWKFFMDGLLRGMKYKFGPTVYAYFTATGKLIDYRTRSNDPANSLRDLMFGADAVELMVETLWDYADPNAKKGEITTDDLEQFIELFTRMRAAYQPVYPAFPRDLHGNNCMYKLVDGKRVWLWTDVDEAPDYMRPNLLTPREMVDVLFTRIHRWDALKNMPPEKVPPPRRKKPAAIAPIVPAAAAPVRINPAPVQAAPVPVPALPRRKKPAAAVQAAPAPTPAVYKHAPVPGVGAVLNAAADVYKPAPVPAAAAPIPVHPTRERLRAGRESQSLAVAMGLPAEVVVRNSPLIDEEERKNLPPMSGVVSKVKSPAKASPGTIERATNAHADIKLRGNELTRILDDREHGWRQNPPDMHREWKKLYAIVEPLMRDDIRTIFPGLRGMELEDLTKVATNTALLEAYMIEYRWYFLPANYKRRFTDKRITFK